MATVLRELVVALAGNPNVGKTTLFNVLTGLKQKVANYPGVTVEKKVGRCVLGGDGDTKCTIVDLPGTYSLASRSPDEHVARQVLLGQMAGTVRPDVIVVVADASNLERNLYLVTQVLELGRPTVVALSMMDIAGQQGKQVDVEKLGAHLRCVVVPVQANTGRGVEALKAAIGKVAGRNVEPLDLPLPEVMDDHIERIRKILVEEELSPVDMARFEAHLLLSTGEDEEGTDGRRAHPKVRAELTAAMTACEKAGVDVISSEIEAHYGFIGTVASDVVHDEPAKDAQTARTDRLDRILTHKVWGMLIFVAVMGLVFVSIFKFAGPVMDWLNGEGGLMGFLKGIADKSLAEGPLKSLVEDGVIAGVGNVVVFLPQIALLFLFIALLEDTGYMARAAFLMDRVMSKVGLHGKSFIPMLSGYACAIPALMGTRVIENRRDRLATIMVLPLMSCSARLPVYTLVIATFFAGSAWLQGGVLLAMYGLGTLAAFGMAWVFKRTLLKGPAPAFILEMPPYRLPNWKVVLTTVGQRCWAFVKRAGTLIFAFSVIMWAATHYPKPATYSRDFGAETSVLEERKELQGKELPAGSVEVLEGDDDAAKKALMQANRAAAGYGQTTDAISDLQNAQGQEVMEHSVAGRVGKFIAPVFRPLGYDWKLSIGVTGAFFAREIVISTLGIVYSVGEADEESQPLKERIRESYSALVGVSLMVFVVFCMQCLPTLVVVRRETNSWGWPVLMFTYMTVLAWVMAFVTYQGGLLLGFK